MISSSQSQESLFPQAKFALYIQAPPEPFSVQFGTFSSLATWGRKEADVRAKNYSFQLIPVDSDGRVLSHPDFHLTATDLDLAKTLAEQGDSAQAWLLCALGLVNPEQVGLDSLQGQSL